MSRICLFGFQLILICCFCNGQDTISWSKVRKLKWEDFCSTVPKNHPHQASTHSGIYNSFYTKGDSIKFTIRADFYSMKSWVKKDQKTKSLLRHEQLHFDITELFARKFRKALTEMYWTKSNLSNNFNKLYKTTREACTKYQELYDAETDHSKKKEKQRVWEERIERELKQYENYSISSLDIQVKR